MSLESDYNEMVARLKKPGQDILLSLTPEKCDLLHMTVGLVGEIMELDENAPDNQENAIKEIGDILFYRQGILSIVGELPETFEKVGFADLVDCVKRHVFYNLDLDKYKLSAAIRAVDAYLDQKMDVWKTYAVACKIKNMEKLGIRYAEGYSDEAAKNRADESQQPVDGGAVLGVHSEQPSQNVDEVAPSAGSDEAVTESIQGTEQTTEVGVPVQPVQEVVPAEGSGEGAHDPVRVDPVV